MSSTATVPTADELRALSEQAQAFVPEAAEQSPNSFLSLAPATSASYPQQRKPSAISTAAAAAAAADLKKRRSSSQSSQSSDGAKSPSVRRFLKLGPVHWGEHLDGQRDDWHEVIVE